MSPPYYGPFSLSFAELACRGIDGVYAIFARIGGYAFPIDIGESHDIGERLQWHDRKPSWLRLLRFGAVTFEVYAAPTPSDRLWSPTLARSWRRWMEWHWRTYYKALGYWLFGDRP